ncbi:achaete-scute complex protein T4-like [Panonychus citri]|uniref:achaete-scute complex protein T4-like n=1 Tax=Panonychus citri TaxID=50023 RepID=UPI002307D9FB|nr:achaete-scute complex protein T4-like [Panonychus citri]
MDTKKSMADTKKKMGKSSYKHIPHREKPAHLVARRNARERRRVQAVNSAFAVLRTFVPVENRNKRLSKVKTLQKAIEYISHLQELLNESDCGFDINNTVNCSDNSLSSSPHSSSSSSSSVSSPSSTSSASSLILSPGSTVNLNENNIVNNNDITHLLMDTSVDIKLISQQSTEIYSDTMFLNSPDEMICDNINKENIVETKWNPNDNVNHNHNHNNNQQQHQNQHHHGNMDYFNNNTNHQYESCNYSYYQPFCSNAPYDGYSQVTI